MIAKAPESGTGSNVFVDEAWYLSTYPDVAILGLTASDHYVRYGAIMGRSPGPDTASTQTNARPFRDAFEYVAESFAAYRKKDPQASRIALEDQPLASVIVTTHNSERTVAACLESLICQTWANLEIVIVDDASSDGTWNILKSFRDRYKKTIRLLRLECNMGTYIAKSQGIKISRGDFVLFQDSDDYSHPERIAIQVRGLIANASFSANRCKYVRFDSGSHELLPVDGHDAKFGLITLCVRRSVFDEIGFFDFVRRAGDNEWFERLRHIKGKKCCDHVDCALYLNEFRPASLAADLLQRTTFGISQVISGARREYVRVYSQRFSDHGGNSEFFRETFTGGPVRNPPEYPAGIAALQAPKAPVFCAICSIPERQDALSEVVRRLLPESEGLFVYLDRYASVPDFLLDDRIEVYRSQDFDQDFRDNAKFLPYNKLKKKYPGGFYYFTVDDDLAYPCDYIAHQTKTLNSFKNRVVSGVHGVIYDHAPRKYFNARVLYHYRTDSVKSPQMVNNLGTGTVAFHSDLFENINPQEWGQGGMVDILFSIFCRQLSIPMICVPRTEFWLTDLNEASSTPNLYTEFQNKDEIICDKLREFEYWGYSAIVEVLAAQSEEMRQILKNCVPKFPDALQHEPIRVRRHG